MPADRPAAARLALVLAAAALSPAIDAIVFAQTPAMTGATAEPAPMLPPLRDARTGTEVPLATRTEPYLALHVLPDLDEPHTRTFIRDYLAAAPTLAGVRHAFVTAADADRAKSFASSLGDAAPSLFRDPGGALAAALKVAPSDAATILLDRAGREVLRLPHASPHEHPAFADFSKRVTDATRHQALADYNLPRGSTLAVEGYDVVAYLDDHEARKGSPSFASAYRGVTYHFASAEHRAAFARDPERYLPTYGGWCASAMGAKGTKVEIDPRNFKVKDGRLFLFYKSAFGDALKDWNKHEREWEPAADANWKKLTREDPIRPATQPK